MSTTVTLTALPNGVDGTDLLASVHVAPLLRTDRSGVVTLSQYPSFTDWPATLARVRAIDVVVGGVPLPATVTSTPSSIVWTAIFPAGSTGVRRESPGSETTGATEIESEEFLDEASVEADFDQVVAMLQSYPTLLRHLGLVVDLRLSTRGLTLPSGDVGATVALTCQQSEGVHDAIDVVASDTWCRLNLDDGVFWPASAAADDSRRLRPVQGMLSLEDFVTYDLSTIGEVSVRPSAPELRAADRATTAIVAEDLVRAVRVDIFDVAGRRWFPLCSQTVPEGSAGASRFPGFTVPERALRRLRSGKRYRLRARLVDPAGNSRPFGDPYSRDFDHATAPFVYRHRERVASPP